MFCGRTQKEKRPLTESVEYGRITSWKTKVKDGCRKTRGEADRRRMYSPRGKITRREAIHITIFSIVVGVFTIIGAIAATLSLVYYICDRKKK